MRFRHGLALSLSAITCFIAPSISASVNLELVVSGLSQPLGVTHAGDGSGRLFILQQNGRVLVFDGSQLLPSPFLDISPIVSCCGERGLLGLAFHPDFENNGLFFVSYTNLDGSSVVARYAVSANPNVADAGSASIVLTVAQPFSNHNGGDIRFGPEGNLFIALGDGGSGGDPQNNAQNTASPLGKILRIDVDGAFPYAIPDDNPFVNDPSTLDEIWALGLRNPWRISFDRSTGDLFVGDVGQDDWEEINYEAVTDRGGHNYGWRLMEGNHCFNPQSNCDDGTLTFPIFEYPHTEGCSVTGGFRYRGSDMPMLAGIYFFGDFCSGRIWGSTNTGDGTWNTVLMADTNLSISGFGEDERGELYVVDRNGSVYRLVGEAFCRVVLNQTIFFESDTVSLNTFKIANLGSQPSQSELKVWLSFPGSTTSLSLFSLGGTGDLILPAGFSVDLAPLNLFSVSGVQPKGGYQIGCRVLDYATGATTAVGVAPFTIQ